MINRGHNVNGLYVHFYNFSTLLKHQHNTSHSGSGLLNNPLQLRQIIASKTGLRFTKHLKIYHKTVVTLS